MLSKYKEQIEKLRANNPSFDKLFKDYESAESQQLKTELENKIIQILEKVK